MTIRSQWCHSSHHHCLLHRHRYCRHWVRLVDSFFFCVAAHYHTFDCWTLPSSPKSYGSCNPPTIFAHWIDFFHLLHRLLPSIWHGSFCPWDPSFSWAWFPWWWLVVDSNCVYWIEKRREKVVVVLWSCVLWLWWFGSSQLAGGSKSQ